MVATINSCLDSRDFTNADSQAQVIYDLVCRVDFSRPGFAILRQTDITSSLDHRRALVDLKERLSAIHFRRRQCELGWFTISRFNQKNTTKLHRDGGPAESLLLLGYEPTMVTGEISIADYSACAFEHGMTPNEFLERCNPMYEKGTEMLRPFTRTVECFDRQHFQILVINNSASEFSKDPAGAKWQGVLHGARILQSEASWKRVINSTSIAPLDSGCTEFVAAARVTDFLSVLEDELSSY